MKTKAILALSAAMALAAGGLSACSGGEKQVAEPTAVATTLDPTAFDTRAYATLLSTGPIASELTVKDSSWAQAVRDAGVLRVAAPGFSGKGARDAAQAANDFDAGLAELLARYVLGENGRVEWVAPAEGGCEASLGSARDAEGAEGAAMAIGGCEWVAARIGKAEYAGPYGDSEAETKYGIALPRGSNGRRIVTEFLDAIEADGSYAELWTIALKPVVGGEVPTPPRLVR